VPEILEVEANRRLVEDHALLRPIAKVGAPDAWWLKRGLDERTLRRALKGRSFTTARRRGKLLLLDTSDDGPTLGVHFGMTGRLIIDGEVGQERLVYASDKANEKWDRLVLRFSDGGVFRVRDPRRLGAAELDPDEDRLGPDALTLTAKQLDAVLGTRTAPLKAVLMDQHRIAGLGNLLVDEILWRAGLDPVRPAGALDDSERSALLKVIRTALRVMTRRGGSHTGDVYASRTHGGVCPRDGAPLTRRTVGGRTTWSCPVHQL
jgi:formamidopyrimidine-DNA glycosylase